MTHSHDGTLKVADLKPYAAPKLVRFGLVTQLTAGGSRGPTESNGMGNCSNNPNETMC